MLQSGTSNRVVLKLLNDCPNDNFSQPVPCRVLFPQCKQAYYCSPECQRKQWRAGHKQACRPEGVIQEGDVMQIRGLQNRKDLNEKLVVAMRPDPNNASRWKVRVVDIDNIMQFDTDISVAKDKVFHIRPEK